MKIMLTGATGQLGCDVVKELEKRNIDYIATGRNDFDITNMALTEAFIKKVKPDVIIHCAAYTAVDLAEDEKDIAMAINAGGTKNIALACKDIDAKMIYMSTDYVFSGEGKTPYGVNDSKAPLSVYGLSKLEGEKAIQDILKKFFIVRISWVFGKNGSNFVKTMLRIGQENKEINVVCDQIGSPTYTPDLSILLCDMVESEKYGIYHATNEGYCSWAEFAEEIFYMAGLKVKVNPIKTSQYPSKAKRPLNSRLSKKSLDEAGFQRLPHWKDALQRYFSESDHYQGV